MILAQFAEHLKSQSIDIVNVFRAEGGGGAERTAQDCAASIGGLHKFGVRLLPGSVPNSSFTFQVSISPPDTTFEGNLSASPSGRS